MQIYLFDIYIYIKQIYIISKYRYDNKYIYIYKYVSINIVTCGISTLCSYLSVCIPITIIQAIHTCYLFSLQNAQKYHIYIYTSNTHLTQYGPYWYLHTNWWLCSRVVGWFVLLLTTTGASGVHLSKDMFSTQIHQDQAFPGYKKSEKHHLEPCL